jgi:hypothetical protein
VNENKRGVEKDPNGWPLLKASHELDCDGKNPMTGRLCTRGDHRGYHRDETGAEWLDDGDRSQPEWLSSIYDPRD